MQATDKTEDIRQNKKFANTVGIALLVIFAFRLFFKHQYLWPVFAIAAVLLLMALVIPKLLTPLRLGWEKLGHLLGIMNTYILLTLFYFLILTPLGLLMRLFGKDILKLKRSAKAATYWEATLQRADSSMENQF